MLGKLISALATAKGAVAAAAITATVATGGVVATNENVQQALQNAVQNVTASATECPKPSATGKPEVVALRNSADDKIRDAFREDQRDLEHLRSTQVDNDARQRLNDTVKAADDRLRARLTKALDDVAALTLGREGHESPTPSPAPGATPSPKPDCDRGARASLAPDAKSKVDGIVTAAIADMKKILDDAKAAVAAVPTRGPGRPESPGARPADAGRPSDAGRPAGAPAGAPSPRPTPPVPTPTR